MSYLIFCSFQVGGQPYKMSEILNRHGIEAYHVSLADNILGHDSVLFHHGKGDAGWDLSTLFNGNDKSDNKTIKILKHIKSKYNVSGCFATGSKAYLLRKAGINYKYWSYGSDLDQHCFGLAWLIDVPFWKKIIYKYYFLLRVRNKYRESIRNADSVMISPYQINEYKMVCPCKKLFFLPHFFKITNYEVLMQKKAENKKKICEGIQAKQYFFSSARHVWSGGHGKLADNKGNDVVIRSFEKYLKITDDHNSKLIMVEKGPDVEASKSLAGDLGIGDQIVWIKEMRRDELDEYYQGATLCFGQFGTPVLTFSALEPLSNATPCISLFQRGNLDVPYYAVLPPIFNSKTAGDIAEFMIKTVCSNKYYENLCLESWQWINNNCSEDEYVQSFCNII